MKRLLLTFLLAFLASCTAIQAQHYVQYSANTGCKNHIIRSCTGYASNSEVLYTKDSESGYLELWVEGVAACRIPVPLMYEVKDMRVYGNLLYFCGREKSCGFIAVANLHYMFMHILGSGTPPSTTAISYKELDYRYVASLEKLVVYGQGDGQALPPITSANEHIAAIGRGGTLTSADWVAVHIKYNNMPMTTSTFYTMHTATVEVVDDHSSTSYEPLPEVLLTDDYVAFVRYRETSDEYVIHRCDRNNVAGTYGTAYRYAAPLDEVVFNLEGESLEVSNVALMAKALADMNSDERFIPVNISKYDFRYNIELGLQDVAISDISTNIECIVPFQY
ncbi:MAG: hypothetical protein IJK84_00765 [Bacteroidales bacterium]|nr:hypothetical protein [Bacteroidales bacterium]